LEVNFIAFFIRLKAENKPCHCRAGGNPELIILHSVNVPECPPTSSCGPLRECHLCFHPGYEAPPITVFSSLIDAAFTQRPASSKQRKKRPCQQIWFVRWFSSHHIDTFIQLNRFIRSADNSPDFARKIHYVPHFRFQVRCDLTRFVE
jgi:hypothetical protein